MQKRVKMVEKAERIKKMRRQEANARHEVNNSWKKVGNSLRYKRAAMRESYIHTVSNMEQMLFDGILLNLSPRNSGKSMNIQMRLVRRIVEKRQAQIIHQCIGRSEDSFAERMAFVYGKRCMRELRRYQMCI